MKIEYAGPKPIISEHGIAFKEGKEDKYAYLKHSLQILDAISHEYDSQRVYSYDIANNDISNSDMTDMLLKYHSNMEDIMNDELKRYNESLKVEIDDVQNHPILNDEEKKVYLGNINLMKDYRIQRVKNKLFYIHVIQTIKEQIIEHKIKELNAPFTEKFWHVFQTIQGELSSSKSSINATLDTVEGDILIIKMKISNNF